MRRVKFGNFDTYTAVLHFPRSLLLPLAKEAIDPMPPPPPPSVVVGRSPSSSPPFSPRKEKSPSSSVRSLPPTREDRIRAPDRKGHLKGPTRPLPSKNIFSVLFSRRSRPNRCTTTAKFWTAKKGEKSALKSLSILRQINRLLFFSSTFFYSRLFLLN